MAKSPPMKGVASLGVAAEQFGQVAVLWPEDPPVSIGPSWLIAPSAGQSTAPGPGPAGGAVLQGAGEEGIEMFIGLRSRPGASRVVDWCARRTRRSGGPEPGSPGSRRRSRSAGQQAARQQVLAADEQTIFKRHPSNSYRGIGVVAPFRPGAGVAFDPRVAPAPWPPGRRKSE